jgi:uncharacterized protein YdbL (DUF1318 family)
MISRNILGSVVLAHCLCACSFNFELTSQKTALENQVMGSYKELDDDVIMMASVRGVSKDGKKTKTAVPASDSAKRAIAAKQNQDFNRDDIDDLKQKQIVGESSAGELALVPKEITAGVSADAPDVRLAQALIKEENQDRVTVVERIVVSNENLSSKDLVAARKTYQKKVIEDSPVGTWIQDDSGKWQRKREKEQVR